MRLETFFEKFYQLTEAPNAVAKMRELILQLAVQGKLVPQDSKDEHAAFLVQRSVEVRKELTKGLPMVAADQKVDKQALQQMIRDKLSEEGSL